LVHGRRLRSGITHVHAITTMADLLCLSVLAGSICLLLCNNLSRIELD
jgi:hypothetical protein